MFGLSGSKSSSQSSGSSSSSSSSFGQSTSQQGSTSGSFSQGGSQASSQDSSYGYSTSNIAFEDVFARLFGGAEGTAANLDTSLLTQASNQLFAGGLDFLSSIGGDSGSAYLTDRLEGRNDVLEAQKANLKTDIGKLFREELLPGVTSEAVRGGQLGGGRQGVAQGMAADAAAEAYTRGATELSARDQARRDTIAQGIANRNIQGAQVGLAGMGGLMDIAMGSINAQTMPMQFLASILGDKTVLNQSESSSQGSSFSNAWDFARAFAESFGFSQSTDQSQSRSQSETQSTSSSGSFGIGF